jgi:hypothetical protein
VADEWGSNRSRARANCDEQEPEPEPEVEATIVNTRPPGISVATGGGVCLSLATVENVKPCWIQILLAPRFEGSWRVSDGK